MKKKKSSAGFCLLFDTCEGREKPLTLKQSPRSIFMPRILILILLFCSCCMDPPSRNREAASAPAKAAKQAGHEIKAAAARQSKNINLLDGYIFQAENLNLPPLEPITTGLRNESQAINKENLLIQQQAALVMAHADLARQFAEQAADLAAAHAREREQTKNDKLLKLIICGGLAALGIWIFYDSWRGIPGPIETFKGSFFLALAICFNTYWYKIGFAMLWGLAACAGFGLYLIYLQYKKNKQGKVINVLRTYA